MNLEKLKEEVIDDEGFKGVIYLDHLGHPTVGVGHLITHYDPEYDQPVGTVIPLERVLDLLDADLERAVRGVQSLFPYLDELPEDVQHILVNMAFQLGTVGLSKFVNFEHALYERDFKRAAKEMLDSKWATQTPNRAKRLADRMRAAQEEE